MTTANDYERRISDIEVSLEQEKFVNKEELEEVKNSSFEKEINSKIESLKHTIRLVVLALVVVIYAILYFEFRNADNYSDFLDSLTNLLNSASNSLDSLTDYILDLPLPFSLLSLTSLLLPLYLYLFPLLIFMTFVG